MDPITIAASIAAVKTAMGAAKNIQSISHNIDDLFKAQEEHKKEKKKKEPTTRMQQVLRMRAGDEGYDDETSISAVANQVLAEKENALALESLAKEIDRKWGRGTWDAIIKQRQKLIEEKEATDKTAKENALKKARESKIFWQKVLREMGKGLIVLIVIGMVVGFLFWASQTSKIR
jgi:hypothetical protein